MPVLEDEDRGKKIEENEEREKKHERESKTGENNVSTVEFDFFFWSDTVQ